MSARRDLPDALLALGLLAPERISAPAVAYSATSRYRRAAHPSLCRTLGRPSHYPWPLKPFHQQHPLRAFFGDPRTLFRLDGFDDTRPNGSFTFHNGVDIVATPGTPVYPVVSGTVDISEPFTVGVRSGPHRRFEYWHLSPRVRVGEHVVAGRTILGSVLPITNHLHLSESVDGRKVNPLAPGHLSPYRDLTTPRVSELVFRSATGSLLPPSDLEGRITITAAAYDTPPEPLPSAWQQAQLSPALLTWRITTLTGRAVVAERTTVDFRRRLPPERDFWQTYASDTYQNDPAIGLHYFARTSGQYLFSLTPHPLDTGRLQPGIYLLTVTASDTCGNRGTLSQRLRIGKSSLTRNLSKPGLDATADQEHRLRIS